MTVITNAQTFLQGMAHSVSLHLVLMTLREQLSISIEQDK